MHLRQMGSGDFERAADWLDGRTRLLRWLVAFLRHRDLLPREEVESWSFLLGEGPGEDAEPADSDICCVLAHYFPTGTLYVGGAPAADLSSVEIACEESLLPERIVGDAETIDAWRSSSPLLFARASRVEELDVLEYRGTHAVPQGFRVAREEDLVLLRAYEDLLRRELEEEVQTDMESLVDAGLVLVQEEGGRVQGMIRSNLSDGRYVHGGGAFVHPLFRGQGVGRRLVAGLGAWVRETCGATVILDVNRANRSALAAYEAGGYERVGEGRAVWLPESAWGG